jgi:CheY-like chemotaxis protein
VLPSFATARRVAVVADDEWHRRGLADGLRDLGGVLQVTSTLTTAEARDHAGWADIDVAVVKAAGSPAWDRFGGIAAAIAIRRKCGRGHPLVVLLAEDGDHDLLVLRAVEAGVDHVYTLAELATLDDLERLVLVPDPDRAPLRRLDTRALRLMGLSSSSRPNAGLALIRERELTAAFDGPDAGLSRRRAITLRRDLAEVMRVAPAGPGSAGMADRTLPSWRQLQRIVHTARGIAA